MYASPHFDANSNSYSSSADPTQQLHTMSMLSAQNAHFVINSGNSTPQRSMSPMPIPAMPMTMPIPIPMPMFSQGMKQMGGGPVQVPGQAGILMHDGSPNLMGTHMPQHHQQDWSSSVVNLNPSATDTEVMMSNLDQALSAPSNGLFQHSHDMSGLTGNELVEQLDRLHNGFFDETSQTEGMDAKPMIPMAGVPSLAPFTSNTSPLSFESALSSA
ncbi:hypothetical protein HDU76_012725, partial [Blyttiomyces sp. JEL0837]